MCEMRYKGISRAIVPVEEFVGNFPFVVAFKQREHVGSARVGASQFAGRPFTLRFSNPVSAG
jgi:hypothetical protein